MRVTFGTFSLDVSPDWTLSTVVLAGPVDDVGASSAMPTTKAVPPFQRNLVSMMERVDDKTTLESYLKLQIEGLKQAGFPRKEAAPAEKVTVSGGHPALITEQIINGQAGERVRQMQLICIKSGIAHLIIASHLDGLPFESVRKSYREMLMSFT